MTYTHTQLEYEYLISALCSERRRGRVGVSVKEQAIKLPFELFTECLQEFAGLWKTPQDARAAARTKWLVVLSASEAYHDDVVGGH